MNLDQELTELRSETQRLRNGLINIRRLEYVIPNAPDDIVALRAVAIARKVLDGDK